jgi:hypothetical protein
MESVIHLPNFGMLMLVDPNHESRTSITCYVVSFEMKYEYHQDGAKPKLSVFVFGSNQSGIHGLGAAKYAHKYLKYPWGMSEGQVGYAYGIPTKDLEIKTLPLDSIERNIDRFKTHASKVPDLDFFVTRIGCGLAGYRDDQIATLFKGCTSNCNFAEE